MTKAITLDYSGVDRSGIAPDSLFASPSSRGDWPPTYKCGECNGTPCRVKLGNPVAACRRRTAGI